MLLSLVWSPRALPQLVSPSAMLEPAIGGLGPHATPWGPSWLPRPPGTWSQAEPKLLQTSLQAHLVGSKLAKTCFTHPRLFLGQAGVITHVGSYIKVGKGGILLCIDSNHIVLTKHLDPPPT